MLIGVKIMHKQQTSPVKSAQQGVILLEAMIAILIFSFAVLGIIGLQAAMVKNTADSKYRADAGYIAQQRVGQIWANPDPASGSYASPIETDTVISTLLPGGTRTVTQSVPVFSILQPNGTRTVTTAVPVAPPYTYTYTVTVTVKWQQPGPNETQHKFTTTASIAGD